MAWMFVFTLSFPIWFMVVLAVWRQHKQKLEDYEQLKAGRWCEIGRLELEIYGKTFHDPTGTVTYTDHKMTDPVDWREAT